MNITKQELLAKIQENQDLPENYLSHVYDSLIGIISDQIEKLEYSIEIDPIGILTKRKTYARESDNLKRGYVTKARSIVYYTLRIPKSRWDNTGMFMTTGDTYRWASNTLEKPLPIGNTIKFKDGMYKIGRMVLRTTWRPPTAKEADMLLSIQVPEDMWFISTEDRSKVTNRYIKPKGWIVPYTRTMDGGAIPVEGCYQKYFEGGDSYKGLKIRSKPLERRAAKF
jgi:nucleoid DNA-binding protein